MRKRRKSQCSEEGVPGRGGACLGRSPASLHDRSEFDFDCWSAGGQLKYLSSCLSRMMRSHEPTELSSHLQPVCLYLVLALAACNLAQDPSQLHRQGERGSSSLLVMPPHAELCS